MEERELTLEEENEKDSWLSSLADEERDYNYGR